MKIHELKPAEGAVKKNKRVGRGIGSGLGKTSGRGQKGQKARSGGGVRPGFEGGQMPLIRKIPKRGFNNKRFRKEYTIVNIQELNKYPAGTVVNLELLQKDGIVKKAKNYGLKVLGAGELKNKLTIQAVKFSKTAEVAIMKAGGKIEVVK